MKIYQIPLPPDIEDFTVGDPAYGLFQGLPSNEPVKVLVRVYIVKVCNLFGTPWRLSACIILYTFV